MSACCAVLCCAVLQNRWRKRGLAVAPTKFGIAFTKLTYNQGGALVHVYTDGTVGGDPRTENRGKGSGMVAHIWDPPGGGGRVTTWLTLPCAQAGHWVLRAVMP